MNLNSEAIVREGKRKLLSLMHSISAGVETVKINNLLKHYDTSVTENAPADNIESIMFIVTRFVRFHGGQTSVLQLGTQLSRMGYKVSYAVYKKQSREEMKLCASSNLAGFEGSLCTAGELGKMLKNKRLQPDAVVATSWDTVYYAKKMQGYKMYFVQDYEPYFYTYGEQYLLAKKTYEQGLHMISLGNWNRDMIYKNCFPVSRVDSISFPCDTDKYKFVERDFTKYPDKKTIVMAVYVKYYGKRLPCIVQYMADKVRQEFAKDGKTLEIKYFGEDKIFKMKGGTNLGQLSRDELCRLYSEADFGMSASLSNISLVPCEMMSAGLPLIEFEDGTYTDFFPQDTCILTSIDYRDLYRKLKAAIENPEFLEERTQHAREALENLGWRQTGEQFEAAMKNRSTDGIYTGHA